MKAIHIWTCYDFSSKL